MCGICGGTVCNGGLCTPSTLSFLYQYAHYGFFLIVGIAVQWKDRVFSFLSSAFARK